MRTSLKIPYFLDHNVALERGKQITKALVDAYSLRLVILSEKWSGFECSCVARLEYDRMHLTINASIIVYDRFVVVSWSYPIYSALLWIVFGRAIKRRAFRVIDRVINPPYHPKPKPAAKAQAIAVTIVDSEEPARDMNRVSAGASSSLENPPKQPDQISPSPTAPHKSSRAERAGSVGRFDMDALRSDISEEFRRGHDEIVREIKSLM